MSESIKHRLDIFCRFRGGIGFPEPLQGRASGDHPFIKVSDMNLPRNERVIQTANNYITIADAQNIKSKPFPPGSTVFAKVGAALKLNRRRLLKDDTFIDNNMMAAIPLDPSDSSYLFYLLQLFDFGKLCQVGAVPSVNQGDLSGIKAYYPPKPERNKIAEILGACDEAIEAQERLIAQKQQRKKGLMQKLLTGEVRFPEFEGTAWREVAIGSLLKEVKRPVEWDDEEQYKLLSLRRRSGGPFARESLYGREIKTKTLKTVRTGDFLIAKMQVTHGALGLVTPEFDQYKVSASYICLVPRVDESFDIRFFNYLSQLRYIWHLAYVASYGVTIEKMTFVPKDFLKKKISVPSTKEECSAIADFIDSVNEEIAVQEKQLEQLKQQKKGLMQQLLTGKVRVKV